MCSRYALTTPIEPLRALFRFESGAAYPPRYNIAPTQPVAVVRLRPGMEASGRRELALVRWGLLPPWVKDPATFATLVVARAETLAEKPSFKIALRHRRCIVPADAWYEWTGPKGNKTPHRFARTDGAAAPSPLAFAALWEHWLGAEGSELETMAIVTVPARGAAAALHDRMPALLEGTAVDRWLDVRGTPPVDALAALTDGLPASIVTRPLGRAINDPRAEGAHLQAARPETSD